MVEKRNKKLKLDIDGDILIQCQHITILVQTTRQKQNGGKYTAQNENTQVNKKKMVSSAQLFNMPNNILM